LAVLVVALADVVKSLYVVGEREGFKAISWCVPLIISERRTANSRPIAMKSTLDDSKINIRL
jgi:hypothetical protein